MLRILFFIFLLYLGMFDAIAQSNFRRKTAKKTTTAYINKTKETAKKNISKSKKQNNQSKKKYQHTKQTTQKRKKGKNYRYNFAEEVISYAQQFKGVSYNYGGTSPNNGFDCSGFTQYVFQNFDIDLKRTAQQQSTNGKRLKLKYADMGDLVVFGKNKRNITHIGIVVSDKYDGTLKMIHASSSKGIIISDINNDTYWRKRVLFAVRLF